MNQRGLISIEYEPSGGAVIFKYDLDAPYELSKVIAYVEELSDDTDHIQIYEQDMLMHNLRYVQFPGDAPGWVEG